MVDVQSTAADIRRGKKRRKKKPQGKNVMSASATQGGHINNNSPEFSVRLPALGYSEEVYGTKFFAFNVYLRQLDQSSSFDTIFSKIQQNSKSFSSSVLSKSLKGQRNYHILIQFGKPYETTPLQLGYR